MIKELKMLEADIDKKIGKIDEITRQMNENQKKHT